MRSPLNALITQHVLESIAQRKGYAIIDRFGDDLPADELKNVCARVHVSLAAQIDECVEFLGISKRRFLEAAYMEACRQTQEIGAAEGLLEAQPSEPGDLVLHAVDDHPGTGGWYRNGEAVPEDAA